MLYPPRHIRWKFRFFCLLAAAPLWGGMAASDASTSPRKILILAGQSNGVGKGDGSRLGPGHATSGREVLMIQRGGGWTGWQPVGPYTAPPDQAKMYQTGPTMFGPEVALAGELSRRTPGQSWGIIKSCVGGTSVIVWSKDANSEAAGVLLNAAGIPLPKFSLYDRLLEDIRTGLDSLGEPYEIVGLLWVQGEKDSMHPGTASAWLERVIQLRDDLVKDLALPDPIPVYVTEPHIHMLTEGTENAPHLVSGIQKLAAEGGEITVEKIQAASGLSAGTPEALTKELARLRFFTPKSLFQAQGAGIMRRALTQTALSRPDVIPIPTDGLPTHEASISTPRVNSNSDAASRQP